MDIAIASHDTTENLLTYGKKDTYYVIWISSPESKVSKVVELYSKSYWHLQFDDIDCPYAHYTAPKKNDVLAAFNFVFSKDNILVTCKNGLSLSAALAYAIKCRECDPHEAIRMLTKTKLNYHPNKMIIQFAAEILSNKNIYKVYENYFAKTIIVEKKKNKELC